MGGVGAALFAAAMLLGAGPAYAADGTGSRGGTLIVVVLLGCVCVASGVMVSWMVLRGVARRHRARQENERWARRKSQEREKRP